jgi:glycosyltransferase involved in cell wall biosynthesis
MKIAFIHNEKKIKTGAHYINDLMANKLKDLDVDMKNFYPQVSLDAPAHLGGLKNILFFHSLLEKRNEILKYDLIQGTTYTPLPFLAYDIPVISHFGSTTKGFLQCTPLANKLEPSLKKIWYEMRKDGAIKEVNIKTRRPLRDIAEVEQYVASKSEAVIATSIKVKNELLEMGIDEDKIHMIHNAIEDYWFDNNCSEISTDPSIVFLGRIGNDAFNLKLKGIDRLIHLYSYFPNVKKITVGMTTNRGLTSWMLSKIPKHSLFININKEKIPDIIGKLNGSILFIPSRYEGFSLSLVEGMSQGLVPVVYSVGVAPEIIINGKNGFVVSDQKEAIEKIKILLADNKLRKKCSVQAKKTAAQFSSSAIAKRLIGLYQKIAQNKS